MKLIMCKNFIACVFVFACIVLYDAITMIQEISIGYLVLLIVLCVLSFLYLCLVEWMVHND